MSNSPLRGFLWSWELYLLFLISNAVLWVNFSWPRLGWNFSSSDFLKRVEQNILPLSKHTHTPALFLQSFAPLSLLVIEILPRLALSTLPLTVLPCLPKSMLMTHDWKRRVPALCAEPGSRVCQIFLPKRREKHHFSPSSECPFPREFLQVLSYLHQKVSSLPLIFFICYLTVLKASFTPCEVQGRKCQQKCPQWQCNLQGAPGGSGPLLPPRMNISRKTLPPTAITQHWTQYQPWC